MDAPSQVKNFKRTSWHTNSYVQSRFPSVEDSYEVSFVFDLLTRSAEEIAAFANLVVDRLFKKTNSQLEAPSAFYRAILYAGSLTIDDPALRDKIDVYTENCFDKVLPLLGKAKQEDKLDEFYKQNGIIDSELRLIPIELESGQKITWPRFKKRSPRTLTSICVSKKSCP